MRVLPIALCMLTFLAVVGCKPFKVIDPNDPGFDIEKFSCLDYSTNKYLLDVFRKYFPLGSDQQYVEEVLIERGGCRKDAEGIYVSQQHYAFSESPDMSAIISKLPVNHYVVYHVTYKKPWVTLTPGGNRPIEAFFDKDNKLVVMFSHGRPIHITNNQKE